jgi:hypothetical protein
MIAHDFRYESVGRVGRREFNSMMFSWTKPAAMLALIVQSILRYGRRLSKRHQLRNSPSDVSTIRTSCIRISGLVRCA